MEITNPATGEAIKSLETDTEDTIRGKFEESKKAQTLWAKTHLEERLKIVETFKDLLLENTEKLAKTLTLEMGKPISQARGEIKVTGSRIEYFLRKTKQALERDLVFKKEGETEEWITREPLGVIANISAWNYPYFVGSNVFIPAILTGNAVLYKPSEYTTLTGLSIHSLFDEAGLPEGVFTPVIGTGNIGAELIRSKVDGIYFTGSVRTGKRISEALSGRFIKLQLELGGKDPTYVCEDTDIETAAESLADGAFYNNGQSCCSVERIYVNKDIYESFLEHFIETVKAFRVGNPLDEDTYIGPLTRAEQIGVLEDHIQDAFSKGGKLRCGGKSMSRNGHYFEPTVISHVNHDMKVMSEESFGPIIGVQKVSSDEEAIRLMNDTEYGLTSGVYTKNQKRAESILAHIQSGSVYWNCCDRVSPNLPWTGRKNSGMGSTLGIDGILSFTQPKAWHMRY